MPTVAEVKQQFPDLDGLDDNQIVDALHSSLYSDMARADVATALGVKPPAEAAKPRSFAGIAKDVGISAIKGAIGVPEAAVGLADIVSGGRAGKLAERAGFRPKEAKQILESEYSPEQQAAFREVQDANGVVDIAKAALSNPSTIAHSVVESIPSMGAGGVVARGALALAPKIGGVVAGALGEGGIGAGQAAEQIRQETPDGLMTPVQSGLASVSGALDTVFGLLGGKVAQKLGIADIDTMLSGAATNPKLRKGVVRSVLEGAAAEGVLEELPQSIQEQVVQNAALGKPLDEGVDQSAVMGLLAGAAMGGGGNLVAKMGGRGAEVDPAAAAAEAVRAGKVAEVGVLSKSANLGTEARAQVIETTGADPAAPDLATDAAQAEPPVLDPVMEQIKSLPDPARGEAMAAYNIINRPDVPKGVRQYNSRLLDQHLDALDPAVDAGAAELPPAAAPAAPEPAPTAAAAATRDDPGTVAAAPEAASIGQFPTMEATRAYISNQRRAASVNLPPALPLEHADGTHSVAMEGSAEFGEAQRQANARQMVAAGVRDGDLLNPSGGIFKTKMAAWRVQKKTPDSTLVPVEGGFVVRPGDKSAQVEKDKAAAGTDAAADTAATPGDGAAADQPAADRATVADAPVADPVDVSLTPQPGEAAAPAASAPAPARKKRAKPAATPSTTTTAANDKNAAPGTPAEAQAQATETPKAEGDASGRTATAGTDAGARPLEAAGVAAAAPTVLDHKAVAKKHTGTGGQVDMTKATEDLVGQVQDALDAGKAVNYFVDGKPHAIVAIKDGMMQDGQGQRWGTLTLWTAKNRKNRLEIGGPVAPASEKAPAAPPAIVPEAAGEKPKITDAGEKIGGSRKDRWRDRGLATSDLDEMSEGEGAELATKANVWKPDYTALVAAGAKPEAMAMVKMVYDGLAAKPKKDTPAARRLFVSTMQHVREVYGAVKTEADFDAAKNNLLFDKLKWTEGVDSNAARAKANAQGIEDLGAHMKAAREALFSVYKGRSDPFYLYSQDKSKARSMVAEGFPVKGEPWKTRLTVTAAGGAGVTPRGVELSIQQAERLGTPVTAAQIREGVFEVRRKGTGAAVAILPTREDADAAAKNLYEAEKANKGTAGNEPSRPHLDKLAREGLPQRIDRDVSSEDFLKDFGFRGVEFGNWSAQDERQRILNMAYDGLADLAELMGLPKAAMSLNGSLGMAFGARGTGKALAHYEPGKLVINMTKLRGGGSLAHEWAHALDHYFGEHGQPDAYTRRARGASGWYDTRSYSGAARPQNLRPELGKAFDGVMAALFEKHITKAEMIRELELKLERTQAMVKAEESKTIREMYERSIRSQQQNLDEARKDPEGKIYSNGKPSIFAKDAQKLSGKAANGYWLRPTEMFARAFESWAFDRMLALGAKSEYLVHGVEADRFAAAGYKGNPYPTGEERARANAAFDTLAAAIESKPGEDGKVVLFKRGEAAAGQSEIQRAVDSITKTWENAPPVVVASSMADEAIPKIVRDYDSKMKSQGAGGQPEAFFYGGKVYMLADQLDSGRVAEVLFHEALGHFGLRGAFGDTLKPILTQITAVRRGEVAAKAKDYGLDMAIEKDRLMAAEEVLAEMAQTRPELGFVKRAIAAIRSWLRANVPQFKDLKITDDEILRDFILPARGWVERGQQQGLPTMEPAFKRAPAVDTKAFRDWFGDSKVVKDGQPLRMFHGTNKTEDGEAFQFFDTYGSNYGLFGQGQYFTDDPDIASSYTEKGRGESPTVYPVYLKVEKPIDMMADADRAAWEKAFPDVDFDAFEPENDGNEAFYRAVEEQFSYDEMEKWEASESLQDGLRSMGYDGITHIGGGRVKGDGVRHRVYIIFDPEQVKSATGNVGTYDPKSANIMFSRSSLSQSVDEAVSNVKGVKLPAGYLVGDFFNKAGKVGWWHKSVGTMYNLAERNPETFKPVYDGVQNFLNDVSFYATDAADLAPNILPKLDTWKDITKTPLSPADTKAIAAPIFEGTLVWARDARGQPVKTEQLEKAAAKLTSEQKAQELLRQYKITEDTLKRWKALPLDQYERVVDSQYTADMLRGGIVWMDKELREQFKLTDRQISLYREFRAATDQSLTTLAISDMLRFAGKDVDPIKDAAMGAKSVEEASSVLRDYLMSLAEGSDRKEVLLDTAGKMIEKADRARALMDEGYAPLSRFGTHSLDVVDEDGTRAYFGLFESKAAAAKMARRMAQEFPKARITQGTTSEEAYKLFAGVAPETLELFGEMLGLEAQGDDASSKAFQEYLKLSRSSRSAMKRLIQRKGIAGFSEDPGRVLAGFVYSNARQTAGGLHLGEVAEAINKIPQSQGQLKDAAIELHHYIKNPQEEAQALRGLLFAQFLGGSVASAIVNTTQPLTVTFPYLSQFGGVVKAAGQMRRAAADVMKKATGDKDLDAALKLAEEQGIVAPQEVHQLMAQANGAGSLRSGDGTAAGNATATAGNALAKLSLVWGKLFSTAEQFNRRLTFIAAYRTAVDQKMKDPAAFAEKVIAETQFTYNKGSKPRWARGAVGGTLFTFKQYSVNYLELVSRMATQGGPEGKKAAVLMVAVLFLIGGSSGLPFAEDAEDLVDGMLQRLGYSFSTKQARQEFLTKALGADAARFVENGVSGLPGVPIDVSGRMGMGNLIPGTGLFTKKRDYTRDVVEMAGPAGDLVQRGFQSISKLASGEVLDAGRQLLPVAGRNFAKAVDMFNTGMYRDDKGRKVIDVDAYDAFAKAIGFQPNDVARVQDAAGGAQNLIGQNKLRETEIADKWAIGMFERDQAKIDEARAALKDWNEKNPDSPMRIQMPQIIKRVRAMRMSKSERIEKTAPKEIKAAVKAELSKG